MSIGIVLLLFFAMIFAGVPIAFSMIAISGLYFVTGPIPSFVELLPQKVFEGVDFIILTAIPFFLLAGELMNRSGMAERLDDVRKSRRWRRARRVCLCQCSGVASVFRPDRRRDRRHRCAWQDRSDRDGEGRLSPGLCRGCDGSVVAGGADHPAQRHHHPLLCDHERFGGGHVPRGADPRRAHGGRGHGCDRRSGKTPGFPEVRGQAFEARDACQHQGCGTRIADAGIPDRRDRRRDHDPDRSGCRFGGLRPVRRGCDLPRFRPARSRPDTCKLVVRSGQAPVHDRRRADHELGVRA